MNLTELVDLYHNLADDRKVPSFAGETDVIGWINEAQREAAFRARLLLDDVNITVTAPVSNYLVGSNGLWIRRAQLNLATVPLAPVDYRDLDKSRHGWRTQTGTPERYVTRLDSIGQPLRLRLHPIPLVNDTAVLIIVRQPIDSMVEEGDEPEIESRWHEELVHWALYRGYQRPDADSLDVDKALKYYERFETAFGTREAAIAAEAADERERSNRRVYADGTF